jgi:hypothetical protein
MTEPRLEPEPPMCYVTNMAKTHPLIERTYRVVPLRDGTFAVEIAVTGTRNHCGKGVPNRS